MFHKDPNGTCAWNAVITGAKKWILCVPPRVSPDLFTQCSDPARPLPASLAALCVHPLALPLPRAQFGSAAAVLLLR